MKSMAVSEMTAPVRREILDDGICVLIFDRPDSGANIFDAETMRALAEQLDYVEGEAASLRGVILTSAKKSIFVAGADLKTLLRQAQSGELRGFIAEGQRVFDRLAALRVPTCAAIHGAAAGGGYEVTLACDWRVASGDPATKIGLPETTLGLVPAWGGATRLPRLIGVEKATEVILKGKLYSAQEAKQMGLVDELTTRQELLEVAKRKLGEGKRPRREPQSTEREVAAPKVSGNEAPARAFEIIQQTHGLSVENSLAKELDAIVELGETDATQNLIRNFFLAEKYKKGSAQAPAEKIAHAAVIGAGVMGSGIAQWLSSRGVSVILRDVSPEQLNRGLANIEKTYGDAVKRGLMNEEKAREGRARIVASSAGDGLRDVEVVIEAASEKLAVKEQIFRELAPKAQKVLLLATNTSALPISDLAAETDKPERVIGLHFFNPVSRMKLVEVVVGEETADQTIERALAFVRQIAKTPVVVRDSPGFLVNRVLFPYLLEAAELFERGVSAEEIDTAILRWGMPMGPLRLIDEIGVDITVDIAHTLEKAFGARDQAPRILREMQTGKMLGRKTGGGFYKYEGRTQTPNAELETLRPSITSSGPSRTEDSQGDAGKLAPSDLSDPQRFGQHGGEDIANHLMFLMVNEAAMCLEEQVVKTPEDADYGMLLGTGFPPYRGGPLRFAEEFGLEKIVRKMEKLAPANRKFTPCNLLREHAQNGTKFYEH